MENLALGFRELRDPEQVAAGRTPRDDGRGGEMVPAGAAQGGEESGHRHDEWY